MSQLCVYELCHCPQNDSMPLYIAQLAVHREYEFNPCAGPRGHVSLKLSNGFIQLIWVATFDIEDHGRFSSNL